MKLQISYDFTNLPEALEIAKKTAEFADILEVGTQLIYAKGIEAIHEFKKQFPNKDILADAKVVDRVDEIIPLLAKAGAKYITVLSGTSNSIIQHASTLAHALKAKIMLDLLDITSLGQAAHDAQVLDVDTVLFHNPHDVVPTAENLEDWEAVRGNTDLPIFIGGRINKTNITTILERKPQGIIVGEAITKAKDPTKEAEDFKNLISKKE